MSLDAWGDDDRPDTDRLPEGCWDEITVAAVEDAIRELTAEQIYKDGDMSKGISVRFLARLTVLRAEANLLPPDLWPMYEEARQTLDPEGEATARAEFAKTVAEWRQKHGIDPASGD